MKTSSDRARPGRVGSRGFESSGLKYALAGLFMTGAIGVLVWRVVGGGGGDTRRPEPRAVAVTPQGEPAETNYTRVRNEADAREAVRLVGDEVALGAGRIDAVRDLGPGAAEVVGAAATDAIGSFFTGSFDDFLEALRRLGAEIDPEADRTRQLFDRFTAWCRLGEPDLDRLVVRPFEPMGARGGGAEAGPRRVARTAAVEENDGDRPTGVAAREMMMSTEAMFPGVSLDGESAGRPPIEVRVPVRPRSGDNKGGDVVLGVVLAWNAERGLWQPAGFSKSIYSVEEDD